MTFNPVIWNALVFAIGHECSFGVQALEQYADACDGTVKITIRGPRTAYHLYEFEPKPAGRY